MNSSHFKKVILLLVSIGIIILVILGLRIGDIPTGFSDIYNAVFNYSENNLSELIIREIRLPLLHHTTALALPSEKSYPSCTARVYSQLASSLIIH